MVSSTNKSYTPVQVSITKKTSILKCKKRKKSDKYITSSVNNGSKKKIKVPKLAKVKLAIMLWEHSIVKRGQVSQGKQSVTR